jgi:Na+-transporting NADH:ubiquinone oxidoreductase subunit D
VPVLRTVEDGGWFTPLSLMLLAPSAFFLLGLLVWAIRATLTEQAEPLAHTPPDRREAAE